MPRFDGMMPLEQYLREQQQKYLREQQQKAHETGYVLTHRGSQVSVERSNTSMLERIRNLNIERMDLDEAVSLSAFARTLMAEYEQVGSPIPEWLSSNVKELRREIASRLRDSLQKRLLEAKARRESLTPVEEKRSALDREIEELNAKLGGL